MFVLLAVNEYPPEYSNSVIKVEVTMVSTICSDSKMQNISETDREIFTKFSGFGESSLWYPVQNMEGICRPNFGGGELKIEENALYIIEPLNFEHYWKLNLWPHISKMGGPVGSNFFVQLRAFEYSKIKSKHPDPLVKGTQKN